MKHKVFVDDHVRVCAQMCSTCIFRPGNLMGLRAGRVRDMVDSARRDESTIVCHTTLGEPLQAACRGFYDRYPTTPLQLAERLGMIDWVDPDVD